MNSRSEFVPYSSRRRFLSQLALAGAAMPLAQVATAVRAAEPKAKSATAGSGVTAPTVIHVFSKPMHQMSHAETAKLLAECGYGGIDYTVRVPQGHVLPEKVQEDLPRAIDAAHAAGLKVEMITTEITSVREPHAEITLRTARNSA